ncbi:MAG: (2Fe-2S)-binding protein [Chloroflexi bacterium]|nr:MAG: (2Fe-2S)-binding protein [Chloroflexota bacterium]
MGPQPAAALPDLQWVAARGLAAGVRSHRHGRAAGAGPAPPGRHPAAAPPHLSSYSRSVPIADRVAVRLRVNGEEMVVMVPPYKTLLEVLREDLGLTGTKHGCELGECSTCGVLVDGRPYLSCLAMPLDLEGRAITTVEGMADGSEPHPLQLAFAELGAAQCGYCTPAMLLTAMALLDRDPHPTRDAIKDALSGVLCRCTGYLKIFEAVELAASRGGRHG